MKFLFLLALVLFIIIAVGVIFGGSCWYADYNGDLGIIQRLRRDYQDYREYEALRDAKKLRDKIKDKITSTSPTIPTTPKDSDDSKDQPSVEADYDLI